MLFSKTRRLLCFFSHKLLKQQFRVLHEKSQELHEHYDTFLKNNANWTVSQEKLLKCQQLLIKIDIVEKKKAMLRQKITKQKELDSIKQYISKTSPLSKNDQNASSTDSTHNVKYGERFIPARITLTKLKHSEKPNEVLLVGVQKQNFEHCVFVKDLIERSKVDLVLTQIAPDEPYFIKAVPPQTYMQAWKNFLESNEAAESTSFYLNNRPAYLQEIILNQQKKLAVKNNLFSSSSFFAQLGVPLERSISTGQFEPNCFFSPFFNEQVERICFVEFPILKQRLYQTNRISLQSLRKLFKVYVQKLELAGLQALKKKNTTMKLNFDPRLLHYQELLAPNIKHITGAIKLASSTAQRSIALCDSQYSQFITQHWKTHKNLQPFDYSMCDPDPQSTPMTFMEFVEKLVILDLMLEPIIQSYFIKFASFPFRIDNTVGGSDFVNHIFIVWDYYYRNYQKAKFAWVGLDDEGEMPEKPRAPVY